MCIACILYALSSVCIEFWGMNYSEVFLLLGASMIPILITFLVLAQDGNKAHFSEKDDVNVFSVTKMTFCDRRAIVVLHPLSVAYAFASIFSCHISTCTQSISILATMQWVILVPYSARSPHLSLFQKWICFMAEYLFLHSVACHMSFSAEPKFCSLIRNWGTGLIWLSSVLYSPLVALVG